jgi:hypothetical protein
MGASITSSPAECTLNHYHSVASIAFTNGTLIDVAKVEGGPIYKQAMLNGYSPALGTVQAKPETGTIQSILGLLPPWFQSERPHLTNSVFPMIEVLKAATKNYLGTEITNATYVTPYIISQENHELFNAATLGLSLYTNQNRAAGSLAAGAHGIDLDTHNHGEQVVLAVEVSASALTASILLEDQGVLEILRLIHSTDLGLAKLHDTTTSAEEFRAALKTFITTPVDKGDGEVRPNELLRKLVVFGEVTADSPATQALKDVLGEDEYDALVNYSIPPGYGVADPAFAASRGAAMDCAVRLTKCDLIECWSNSYLEPGLKTIE